MKSFRNLTFDGIHTKHVFQDEVEICICEFKIMILKSLFKKLIEKKNNLSHIASIKGGTVKESV